MKLHRLIESMKKHEGYVPTVYDDSVGVATIGYGFAIKDLSLSETVCNVILQEKLLKLVVDVNARFSSWFPKMPAEVQETVIELCYQIGVAGFSKFRKSIQHLSAEKWEAAANEMLDSKWAKQTPRRAKEMTDIIRNLK